jgi:hypothetical protein
VEQVQAVMRIANQYRIPIYPISTGRNLGYGGSAPNHSGSVVLDLKRMNRVLEVNEGNAFALVEPGVSYFDLYRHIEERGLKVWLDVPDPGWGSPLGNSMDRGGVTPCRSTAITSMPTAAWKWCWRTASCCARAWARCRARKRGSNTRRGSGRGSTASSRSRTSA